jgi:hypothetical protein
MSDCLIGVMTEIEALYDELLSARRGAPPKAVRA